MTVSLKHRFHSAQADDPDATLIRPSNWNDEHNLTGTPGMFVGFDGSGNATEVAGSGTTSPASPTNAVQFNNGGVFGGNAALLWENTNKGLGVGGIAITFDGWFPQYQGIGGANAWAASYFAYDAAGSGAEISMAKSHTAVVGGQAALVADETIGALNF